MEMLARQQAAAAEAEAAVAAATAQAAATASALVTDGIMTTAGASMEYSKLTFDLGDLTIPATGTQTRRLPGDFGSALSLIAQVSSDRADHPARYFWWWLATGFNDSYWHELTPAGGSAGSQYRVSSSGTSSIRLHGPFAERLGLGYGFKDNNMLDRTFIKGVAFGVRITLGVQRV